MSMDEMHDDSVLVHFGATSRKLGPTKNRLSETGRQILKAHKSKWNIKDGRVIFHPWDMHFYAKMGVLAERGGFEPTALEDLALWWEITFRLAKGESINRLWDPNDNPAQWEEHQGSY